MKTLFLGCLLCLSGLVRAATLELPVHGADGLWLGTFRITETPAGLAIDARLDGLDPGPYAVVLGETTVCPPPPCRAQTRLATLQADAYGRIRDTVTAPVLRNLGVLEGRSLHLSGAGEYTACTTATP